VAKNALQQMRNQARAAGKLTNLADGARSAKVPRLEGAKDASSKGIAAGIPVDLSKTKVGAGAGDAALKRGKLNTKLALKSAAVSTASMGVFDEGVTRKDLKAGKKGLKAVAERRRNKIKGSGVEKNAVERERSTALEILRSVKVRKEKKDLGQAGMRAKNAQDIAIYDAVEGGPDAQKRKKGRGAQGKIKKLTRKQTRGGK